MPSLWWESGGRVLVEAMMNGIPAFITDRGGMPEMVEDAGIKINFSEEFFKAPYLLVPATEQLAPIVDLIIRMYDDKFFTMAASLGPSKWGGRYTASKPTQSG